MPLFGNYNDDDLDYDDGVDVGVDDVIASHGFDPRSTPIDTLMGQLSLGLEVADFMENSI